MTQPSQSVLSKSIAIARDQGLRELARRIGNRVLDALWQCNSADWYHVSLADGARRMEMPPGVAVSLDDPEKTIAWMQAIKPKFDYAYIPDEIETARREGHILVLLTIDGCNAGYLKVAVGEAYVTDLRRRIRLPSQTAFIYDTFMHPDFRRRGGASLMVAAAMVELRRRGYRCLWCHIPRWNLASQKTFRKNGFRRIGTVKNIHLPGWTFSTRRPERMLLRQSKAFAK